MSDVEDKKFCRLVSITEIKSNDYNLLLSKYLESANEEDTRSFQDALKNVVYTIRNAQIAEKEILGMLEREALQ